MDTDVSLTVANDGRTMDYVSVIVITARCCEDRHH